MTNFIVASFESERNAVDADVALRDLHREGTITLYKHVVVVKAPDGRLALHGAVHDAPAAIVGGMLSGSVAGFLQGPFAFAAGAGAGTVAGAVVDLIRDKLGKIFVESVGVHLDPGTAVVIAEVDEPSQALLDTRLAVLGGTIRRQTHTQFADTYLEAIVEAAQVELAVREAEKVAELTATIDSPTLLKHRLAEVRTEYERRAALLTEALERQKALHVTPGL